VKEYREWLRTALKRWSTHGEITALKKDVASIAKAIDRATGKVSVAPKVEFKLTVADLLKLAAGQPAGPSVDFTPTAQGLWGWFFDKLPGKRYRKILSRAVVADQAYAQIENRLRTVWKTQ
jgi:hypothetical protein